MTKKKIGILHPGNMGISIAASMQNSGNKIYWVSEGRSPDTHQRADKYRLVDACTLENLCETCSVIVCVCPPDVAEEVARQVFAHSYKGIYLDANAISPRRARRIGQAAIEAGATFVDGGIIGGPAWQPGSTWLYLSGQDAEAAASCFEAGPLETGVIGEEIGKASAIKMCYAAYTKGTTALLCAILAAAETFDVREELQMQWSRDGSAFAEEATARVRRVTAKAWRFAGEMDEISSTFNEAGIPGDFHAAAGTIYHRIAKFKDAPTTPTLEKVLAALNQHEEQGSD
jgi:3-hydroxyisobutyrate dehydrogenase-like beta-hydroxyacid dehydrogenase